MKYNDWIKLREAGIIGYEPKPPTGLTPLESAIKKAQRSLSGFFTTKDAIKTNAGMSQMEFDVLDKNGFIIQDDKGLKFDNSKIPVGLKTYPVPNWMKRQRLESR